MRYEKFIRAIISAHEQNPFRSEIPLNELGMTVTDARILEGLGYVERVRIDMSRKNCTLKPGKTCFAYFENKASHKRDFWKEFLSKFISGVLVGVLSTLAVTYLTGLLKL